jgi:hypothetical protein
MVRCDSTAFLLDPARELLGRVDRITTARTSGNVMIRQEIMVWWLMAMPV